MSYTCACACTSTSILLPVQVADELVKELTETEKKSATSEVCDDVYTCLLLSSFLLSSLIKTCTLAFLIIYSYIHVHVHVHHTCIYG